MFGMWDAMITPEGFPLPIPHLVVTEWAIILVLAVFAYSASRRMELVPTGLQNVLEWLVTFTYDFFTSLIENEDAAKKWAPLLSTFFMFIIISNYSGLIPGAAHVSGFQPPTSNWNVTCTLALITAFTVQLAGFQTHGIHYLGHFISPNPVMLPLNLLEEITHPLSLTVRLFGNIFGEEMVYAFMLAMVPFLIPTALMALSLLLGGIQAIVFTLLSANYIAASTGHGH